MGFMSAGIGWNYGKSQRWETDLYLGYLPKFEGPTSELTFTVKENFSIFQKTIAENWNFEALTIGAFATWTTGEHLWVRLPEEYPAKYYYFTTALRLNLCIGERFTYSFPNKRWMKSIGFFYELNTNDLYIASVWDNDNLKIYDILKLSFGIKVNIQ